jgi:hypothetical protein
MTKSSGEEVSWRLFDAAWEQEKYFLAEMHRRLVFFGSLIPALLGATVAGALAANHWWHYVVLLVGPVAIHVVTTAAADAMRRSYRRVLEAIAMRAKCEFDLGLTRPRRESEGGVWAETEPYIGGRHLRGRRTLNDFPRLRDDLVVPFFPVGGATHLRISLEGPKGQRSEADAQELSSSDEFVEENIRIGVHSTYRLFFGGVRLLAVLLGVGFVALAGTSVLPKVW